MKQTICLVLSVICLACLFVGCGNQVPSLDAGKIEWIAITNGQTTAKLEGQPLADFINTVNCSSALATDPSELVSPVSQYSATCYQNNQPTTTILLFSDELLQIDTKLFKGNFADVSQLLGQQLNATTKEELSDVFTAKVEDIQQITMVHNQQQSYKVLVDSQTINTVLSTLKQLTVSNETTQSEMQPLLTISVYYKGQEEPANPIVLSQSSNGLQLLSCDGKSCYVQENAALEQLFNNVKNNPMPLNS